MSGDWKLPNDFLKQQRLKQKQKALQARLSKPESTKLGLIEEQILPKRRNPFKSDCDGWTKRCKFGSGDPSSENSNEDSIFELLTKNETKTASVEEEKLLPSQHFDLGADDAEEPNDEEAPEVLQFLPIDWTLKSKLRVLALKPIAENNLKTNQLASGLSSFVRGVDVEETSTGLDISPGSQFYQSTLYWQHPNIPWMTLYPRNAKENTKFVLGDTERQALAKSWGESFRSLFLLIRARQCPYFYVCANTFTVLFRAAGIGGRVEMHAIVTPTTRGFRQALKEEDIEFTFPLKEKDTTDEKKQNSSLNNSSSNPKTEDSNSSSDDDDLAEEQWLERMGVEANHIQEITKLDNRRRERKGLETDTNEQSTIVIEGPDCQAFFNFFINSKSATTSVGKLAGIPPTLLAPVAFLGATLKNIQFRASKIRMENVDYNSMELKGVILPHVLPHINNMLRKEKRPSFSASMINQMNTLALTKVAMKLLLDSDKENNQQASDYVFGQENLSDCGLSSQTIRSMCQCTPDAIRILDRMCYNAETGGYTFL